MNDEVEPLRLLKPECWCQHVEAPRGPGPRAGARAQQARG